MIKKTIAAAVAAAVFMVGVGTNQVNAVPGKDLQILPIIVNGQKVRFPDTEPYVNTDGRTMVPVRFVSEMLGADVTWENSTQTAIIQYEGKTIRMPIGSNTVTVDGAMEELDTAAEMYEGRTMVPLRFVSEVLDSKVEWDAGAHAVKVTDAKYQAKVDSGEVKLDPWGREYSKTQDDKWFRLTDLDKAGFYDLYKTSTSSRKFIEPFLDGSYKKTADALSSKIRSWYSVQLNVDYRTVDEDVLINSYLASASNKISGSVHASNEMADVIRDYVKWVKENKVIVKGYADPEMSSVLGAGVTFRIPTHFKFMIISANDTSQVFMDNWDASNLSDSFKLKKGVWYDGYSQVGMDSNIANASWSPEFGLRIPENMFAKGSYFYNTETK
jgi:hypothetical protein